MAEEIDIIALWDKGKELNANPELDIDKAISSRSKGTLFWIRVILTIEFWINVAALPVFVYYLLIIDKDYLWGTLAVIVTLIYLVYYQFLIKQIKRFSFEENVKTSLKKLYRYLSFFLLHYKVVIWISLLIGMIKAIVEDVPNQVPPEQLEAPYFMLSVIVVSGIMIIIVGLFFTLLIHLIYGRKIKRLKRLVRQFSE
ncbi:hypothetical protein [Marinoscillum sp.]|uniref:hypothetical protein n=1 Tax=Marinoscillum sp. TaxID=2024838 RepID=UPI003BAB6AC4